MHGDYSTTTKMDDPTFIATDLTDAHPPGICSQCAAHAVTHLDSGVRYVHCEHSQTAAWSGPDGLWMTSEPITAERFKCCILTAIFAVEVEFHGAMGGDATI